MLNLNMTGDLRQAVERMRGYLAILAGLGAALNVLMLGGSIYLMLVYDSVLPSQSVTTLLGLLIMVLIVYLFQAAFEIFRSRMLADMAVGLTTHISPRVQQLIRVMALKGMGAQGGDGMSPLRDLDTVRGFLSGPGPAAFMDLPWVVFFLGILTLLHPWLGFTALIGALVMIGITLISARRGKVPTETVIGLSGHRFAVADEARRHAEIVHALGMGRRLNARWERINQKLLAAQDTLTSNTAVLGGLSRVFRLFLQSLVLSVGALLVIDGKASGGVIFASSIIAARALAPIDQVVAQWKSFAAARAAWNRLASMLAAVPAEGAVTLQLPAPDSSLAVEGLVVSPPGSQRITAQGINFRLEAGDALGVIGMSAAGKSSLVRTLLGVWVPVRGSVRLDGAELTQWDPAELGQHIGYVPQTVELLPGTVAENIARFTEPLDSAAVLAAARAASIHDMILELPEGYETQVGRDGEQLSAGQRQRIALARALFGEPFLVVLDEPNSNLDAAGEVALDQAIENLRNRKAIVVIVAHRRGAIARVSHLLVMREGRVERFGPRDEVLRSFPQSTTAADAGGMDLTAGSIRTGRS